MSYCAKLLRLEHRINRGCCCLGEINKDEPTAYTTVPGGLLFLSSVSQHCLQNRCNQMELLSLGPAGVSTEGDFQTSQARAH